jgi:hypothetical protein
MKTYHTYIIYDNPPSALELLVQLISVCNHKSINPEIPIVFVTNQKSLDFFNGVGFLNLYDQVITDVFDDYPYERVSPNFWATPKLWLMSHLKDPFLILDTDLILNVPIKNFQGNDLTYLHRELQSGYLRPHEVSVSPSWNWDNLLYYFKRVLPINVSVLHMKNMDFKDYYVKTYFNFVLDNPGNSFFEDEEYIDKTGVQTFAEQYLLSSLSLKYKMEIDGKFNTKSLSNLLHGYGFYYDSGDFDRYSLDGMNPFGYHLWSAKKYINEPDHEYYVKSYRDVTESGQEYLKRIGYWDEVKDVFLKLKSQLPLPIIQ